MSNEIKCGQIVQSLQGRDKGDFYIVLEVNSQFARLADGKSKTILTPKKKNLLHIRPTNVVITEIAEKLKNGITINNQMVYHSLYEYKKRNKGE